MYKGKFNQVNCPFLIFQYNQGKSQVIIKSSKISPCTFPQSQTGLYLDISIKEQTKNQLINWTALQNYLRELFDLVIYKERFPNSMIKIWIFILQNNSQVKETITNGIWISLLKLGVPMQKSIFSYSFTNKSSQKQSNQRTYNFISNNKLIVYDLNKIGTIVYGQNTMKDIDMDQNNQTLKKIYQQYKVFVQHIILQSLC